MTGMEWTATLLGIACVALAGRRSVWTFPTGIASVLLLWYLAIWFSGLPAFVIPRPERVIDVLDLLGRLEITQLGLVTQRITR